MRLQWRFDVFNTHPGLAPLGRHERQSDEFDHETHEMAVVRLSEAAKVIGTEHIAENQSHVRQYEAATERAARLPARPGPLPDSSSSVLEKNFVRSSELLSNRSMRSISTVSNPQRAPWGGEEVIGRDRLKPGLRTGAGS